MVALNRRNFLKSMCAVCGGLLLKSCAPRDVAREKPETEKPGYAKLEEEGKLVDRIDQAFAKLENCDLCPRQCGVNRVKGEKGFCRTTDKAVVHSHSPHFGEEPPLVGSYGSGTIFFSNCNLRCVFCQNYPLAHEGKGQEVSDEDIAEMMITLQNRRCHNINVVTPTHIMPNILKATRLAYQKGLRLPLCYNTSGYERVENIKLLDGIVDIYLPDLKFMDGDMAERYNEARAYDYPDYAKEAIIEMNRQVGKLEIDQRGIAVKGLILRHLVMPNRVSSPKDFAHWVAENLSKDTYVNIMAQYRVEHDAFDYDEIARTISPEEYVEAMEWAKEAGLTNFDERSLQDLERHRRRLD